ncbi:MAG: PHP domain-containing protein [Magnetococcales bacterium]|nr:PHP domain-containing protein [Magnetococcales bacterium]
MKSRARSHLFLPARTLAAPLPNWEYHAHSTWSDGRSPLKEMCKAARLKGVKRLIFTEHTEPELVQYRDWFVEYREEVHTMREQFPGMEILAGLEAPVVDFAGNIGLDAVQEREAEFILGAVHTYPGTSVPHSEMPPEEAIRIEFEASLALLSNPRVDAIAHPGGICHLYITPFPMTLFRRIVQEAVLQGVAVELNPAYQDPIEPWLEICREENALISPGSNAHSLAAVGLAWRKLTQALA